MLSSSTQKKVWVGSRIQDVLDGRFVQKPSAILAGTSYSALVLASLPKVFYKMQEASGALVDSSGNGTNTTGGNGSPTYHQTGPFGSDFGIRFASANLERTAVSSAVNNFTYEFWFYPITAGGFDAVICGQSPRARTGSNPGSASGEEITWSASGQKVHFSDAGVLDMGDSSALSANTWVHCVFVRDSGVMKYYFGGVAETPTGSTTAPVTPLSILTIGSATSAPSPGDFRMAYFAFYETALSASTILSHATAGAV